MRSVLFWVAAAVIGFLVTRNPWMLGIAAAGPVFDKAASKITRQREPDWVSWQLTSTTLIALGLLVWGTVTADAALIVVGSIVLTGAAIYLRHRRRQAEVP